VSIVLATCLLLPSATSQNTSRDQVFADLEWGERLNAVPCMDDATRNRIKSILLRAIDRALMEHTITIYDTLLKDKTGQPARARTGMRHGINVWLAGRALVQDWDPDPCPDP
jgi:hypothetical protein